MQTSPPLHYNTHQKQIAQNQESMTGSSPVSPASSSSPASSASASPAHLGSLANDSLDGPASFASPKLQLRGGLVPGLWVPDLSHCNQSVKGQPWDKTHAEIAEQAKHEAKIEHRIAELRREGLWSLKRLNRVQEPPRLKTHWDYLCEEMQWLSGDFAQERRWKRGVARKVARTVLRFHEEQRQKEERAKRDEQAKLRRIASTIAKEVKQFWTNVEKVVQFKQQSRLEEKRKKALDLQLDFIVGQTEKYSDLLSQSLNESLPASKPGSSQLGSSLAGSAASSPPVSGSATEDEDFEPHEEEDDEETIEVEEKQAGNDAETRRREIELLRRESELPLEEVLRSLPAGLAEEMESGESSSSESSEDQRSRSSKAPQNTHRSPGRSKVQREELEDEEFTADDDEGEDEEETIDAEEELAGDEDHKAELDTLAKESELPVEVLLKKYSEVFSDSFDTPESDSDDSSDTEEEEEDDDEEDDETSTEDEESSSSTESEDSSATDEDEEEEEVEEEDDDAEEDIGVEYLLQREPGDGEPNRELVQADAKGPKKEITDIAAAAESLQPKGYTLATTQVKTPVPVLLRGTLREYQHIGLDWLVTMYEKKLNGILADEMGLGKTIQTIALLAHLAIEKGNWGPHLIIVPTSVMLNWEMEFKRWCPSFKILTYYGVQKERKMKRQGWTKPNAFHVCITSYKLVLQDHQAFRRKNWKYMILDEAQNIKNFKSQRWQSLLNFNSQRRLLLTGTPLQNSLMELWSLMHFLMPHVFQSHREFKEWFSNPLTGMIEGSQEYNENLVKRLHKVLRPFLLRRIKVDVEKQMPKKYEHVVQCRLSKRQRYLYDDFMSQASTRATLETGHFMSVINILMQLRKVCNHPNLFDPRPIHSPFIIKGICYTTASCILRALEHEPFKVDLSIFDLINIEGKLSKYEADVFLPKNKVSKMLIEEISEAPDPPPRPKPVRMKVNRMFQPAQKPDGRTVVLVNSPRPPLPMLNQATQLQPLPLPSLRPPGSGVAEMLHTMQTTTSASLHSIINPVTQAVISSQGLSAPLALSHVVTSAPRTILSAPRHPMLTGTHQHVTVSPSTAGVSAAMVRPFPLSALRVTSATLAPGAIGNLVTTATVQSPPHHHHQQALTGYTVQGANTTAAVPQRFILSPDVQARLPTGEVVSIGQLASLANRQGHQATQGSKPVTFQIQGNKLTLAGAQVRQVAVGQPRQIQGNVVHLVSTGGHHIIGQPTQLALIQAMAHQNAQATVGVQASLQTVTGPQSTISTASPGLTVPLTAAQVPGSVVTSSGVVKIVVRQPPKEGFPLGVHSPRPLTVSAARFPATMVTPARVQLPMGTLALNSAAHLAPAPRPVLRVVHAPALHAEQAAPTVTRLVVASPNLSEKDSTELPTLRPVLARPLASAQPLTSTSLAAQRPRRHPAPPPRSPFQLEALEQKRRRHRQERLERIYAINERRCAASPIYGTELLRLCAVSARVASSESPPEGGGWRGLGYAHCLAAQVGRDARRPEAYWRTTRALDGAVRNPEERIEELADIIERFIFVIPPVEAPAIRMHVSHPHPSDLHRQVMLTEALHHELSPRTARLHRTICNMRTQFPDLRLIQYDCGKLQVLDLLLRRLKTGSHRVLLFTQMTRMLDILEQFLNFHGHIYLRLDGSTKVEQRQILMDRFNADKRIFCFILSTRSGGVGVNLTGADTVLFYDSDWNPTMDAQAQDRCHRIGQTRDVHIYRLISDRTVEENILKKASQKRMLGNLAIEGGNFTTAFFKEQTIRELFDLPTDLPTEEPKKELELPTPALAPPPPVPPPRPEEEDSMSAKQTQILEQALCRAEDEEDIRAASQAKAEQVAELAEFNENIPLDGEDGAVQEEELSKAEQEIAALVEQLTPIERYAMNYLEASLEAVSKEELKQAEEQVEAARKDLDQAKDEVWKWNEEDEQRLSEELHGRRQKKARPPPKAQGERPSTRMSERLRGARLSAREAEKSEGGGPGRAHEAPAALPKELDSRLLRFEAPSRDLQIHISTELPEEIFEDEPAPPEELPTVPSPPLATGGLHEAEARGSPAAEESCDPPVEPEPPPGAESRESAESRPDEGPLQELEPVLLGAESVTNGGSVLQGEPPAMPNEPDEAEWRAAVCEIPSVPEEDVAAPSSWTLVAGQKLTVMGGGQGVRLEGRPLALGQASDPDTAPTDDVPKENTVQKLQDGGSLAPNGLDLERPEPSIAVVSVSTDTGSPKSEESIPRASVTADTGSQRLEEHILKSSVTADTGSQRLEERIPKASVTADAGSQRLEEHILKSSVTADTGSQRLEERIPKASVTADAGSQRSEEHIPKSSVTADTGSPRSEEHIPKALVTADTGSQRSEEHIPKASVTVDTGSQRSEEHIPKASVTTDTGSQRLEECIPRTLVTVDTGSQRSGEQMLNDLDARQIVDRLLEESGEPDATVSPETEEGSEEPVAGKQEVGAAKGPCRSPQTERLVASDDGAAVGNPAQEREPAAGGSAVLAAAGGVAPATDGQPAPQNAGGDQSPPLAANQPGRRESEQKRLASDRESVSPATGGQPVSGGKEKKRRRTADQELLRGSGDQNCAQVMATVLRKVPGRINVIVERRAPTKRARRRKLPVAVGGEGEATNRDTPAPKQLPNIKLGPRRRAGEPGPSGESGSSAEGHQPPVKRPRASESASPSPDTGGETPASPTPPRAVSSSSSSTSGEERSSGVAVRSLPTGESPATRAVQAPRSTRQRPGDLMPPLERKRYKPRGVRVAPRQPAQEEVKSPKQGRGQSGGEETPSARDSSSSSSSSPSPPTTPDRVLRSLTAAAAVAATTPAANTRSALGASPAPLPATKRKARPASASPPPAPCLGRGWPPKVKSGPAPHPLPGAPRRGRPPKLHPKMGCPPNHPPAGQQPQQQRRGRGRPPGPAANPPKRRGRPPSVNLGCARAGRKPKT